MTRETHFTEIELQRWRECGPGEDRDRIVAHLAACADCASCYAAAIRAHPLETETVVQDDVREFVTAGYRVPRPGRTFLIPAMPRRWIIGLTAAILLFAIATPRLMRRAEPPSTPTFRGGGIYALAPEGAIAAADVVFVWSSSISTGRYRIEVGDSSGPIYATETDQSRFPAPGQLRELLRLHPGGEFWWTVTALDTLDKGKPLVSSSRRTFTIRPQ
jgi:hypothetical protein